MSRYKDLISQFSIYAAGGILEKAIVFFLIPLYTALLMPEDFGIVGVMTVVIGIATKFVSGPVSNALTRFYYAPGYKEKNGELIFNLFLWAAFKAGILSIILFFMSDHLAASFFENPGYSMIIKWYAVSLFVEPLELLARGVIRLQERAKYFVVSSFVSIFVRFSVILLLLVKFDMGVVSLVIGNMSGYLASFLMMAPICFKSSRIKISPKTLKEPFQYSYPQLGFSFSNLLLQSGDRLVLKIFMPLAAVGIYSFGYNFANIINVALVIPLKYAINPMILKEEANPEVIRSFLAKMTTYYYAICLFIVLGFSLFSYEALSLLSSNPEYLESLVIVPIIAFSYALHGLGELFNWGLVLEKKSYHISAIIFLATTVNVILNFIMIPLWGLVGAALATLFAYFLWNSLKAYFSWKFYKLTFEIKKILLLTALGVGLYFSSLVLAATGVFLLDAFIKGIIVLSFPITLYASGFITKDDVLLIRMTVQKKVNGVTKALNPMKVKS